MSDMSREQTKSEYHRRVVRASKWDNEHESTEYIYERREIRNLQVRQR